MIRFTLLHPQAVRMLGIIPTFLSITNPAKARDQLNTAYQHGGGWQPLNNWQLHSRETGKLQYPNDPPMMPIAFTHLPLTSELIYVYPHSWVMILQPDGSFEVARMD